MAPEIGAGLLALASAAIGVVGIVTGVYLTAKRAGEQRRQELVGAALSDYMRAAALTGFTQDPDALAGAHALATEAKARVSMYADADVIERLVAWDRNPVGADPAQQRAMVQLVLSVRSISDPRGVVPTSSLHGLLFGWDKPPSSGA